MLQDQILFAVRTGQEATLHLAKAWVETFALVTPKFFDRFATPKMDDYYGFAAFFRQTEFLQLRA